MAFVAHPDRDQPLWYYIIGNIHKDPDFFTGIYANGAHGVSIAVNRYYYLFELDLEHKLKIAFRDPATNTWSRWGEFPGQLFEFEKGWTGDRFSCLTAAIDVHRNLLPNEIVIESDYPTYDENYDAAKIIGKIIESKGFIPHYYYSGNKSVHVHVFLDWSCFRDLDDLAKAQLQTTFGGSEARFKKAFILWLRAKMISCWDTNAKQFDTDLIKASHLIRCELSKNKLGFKTFLGYSHRDMSFIPYLCNENNRIYPRLGQIILSKPPCVRELVDEFIEHLKLKNKLERRKRKNRSLSEWTDPGARRRLRECVKAILRDDFKGVGDGINRGFFILLNELKKTLGNDQALILINDWNARMGSPLQEQDIKARMNSKTYSLSCDYIHKFLKELNIDVSQKCKGKV